MRPFRTCDGPTVENFFKPRTAPRKRAGAQAERIAPDASKCPPAKAAEDPWPAGERILACVGSDPSSPTVVRNAKRLADLMHAPWLAVTVEPAGDRLDAGERQRLDEALKLA